MEDIIQSILSSEMKHKEQVARLVELAKADDGILAQLCEMLRTSRDVEKGTVAEVMKFVSKDCPERLLPYIDLLIEYIDYRAPRVRWGCPESLGNMAVKYPHEVAGAIPKLLSNLEDKSTVVRWCAAFALTEIAKYSPQKQDELAEKFHQLIQTESNNGVRNLYVKALKEIARR